MGKGKSMAEKLTLMLEIFHESASFFTYAELEKIAIKQKGITQQSCRPVLDDLTSQAAHVVGWVGRAGNRRVVIMKRKTGDLENSKIPFKNYHTWFIVLICSHYVIPFSFNSSIFTF